MEPLRAADLVADPKHAGSLEGALHSGEAAGEGRLVRVGLWLEGERVVQARFKATTCATLLVVAEAACRLLEAGADPRSFGAPDLRRVLIGLPPFHEDRLELVARAVRTAALGHHPGGQP